MLLILGALLAVMVMAALLARRRAPWSIDTAQLGCVSQQWLAEYRASHPS